MFSILSGVVSTELVGYIVDLIVALASLCAAITGIVAIRSTSRNLEAELFFREKVAAYSELITVLSKAKPQITEDIRDILASSSRAKLFASPQTSQLITKYGSIVMKLRDYLDRGLPTDSVAHEMDQAFKELVNALAAEELIFGRIGRIVAESLMYRAYKPAKLYNHIHTADNAEFIRSMLPEMGLVAFVATGSVLPRRDDDLAPLTDAVPFDCDGCMKVTMAVPHGDPISGLGIKSGFTVIAGCSRAGKSVLLDAIMAGVHDHIPGDGREYVVTVADAVYIMSEAGRPADAVDVSAFLPGDENARVESPSVPSPMSELVAVSEAVEMGSRLILIDEEYSNPCIIRRGFLADDDELIPISELGRSMGEAGVSVIMVSGDRTAAELADRVFRMDGYSVSTASVERRSSDRTYSRPNVRYPVSKNIVYEKGRKEVSTAAQGVRTVEIGEYRVNVPVSGLFDTAQTRAVADAVVVARDLMDGSRSMADVCTMAVDAVMAYDPENGGSMHRARPRPMDLAAVLNRHPQMLCIQKR